MPETLITLGYDARRAGRLNDARQHFSEAVRRCRDDEDKLLLARSLSGLAQIERDLKNSRKSLEHYEEAVAIYRELNDLLRLAHTVRHMGDILRHERLLEPARACYEEALTIYRECDGAPELDVANAIRGFALLREDAGENEEAKELWREARVLYESVGVTTGVQECDGHL